jgi:hypothetical protein
MLKDIALELISIEKQRVSGELKPVRAAGLREAALIRGVMAVAESMGVKLKPLYAIDARGELSIASAKVDAYRDLAGPAFSAEFCDALNTYCKPRCGIFPTAVMEPVHSNWCRINHFDAERMVYAIAAR